MNQLKWLDLSAGQQQLLRAVAEYGMLTAPGEEETPEMIEIASDLITNWQLVEKTPASLTLYPSKSYRLTDAGKAVLPARLRAKFAKFDSGFRVGDFVQVDTFMGNDDLVSGQVTKVDGMYIWLDGKEEPYNVACAIKLENVITIEDQVKAGLKPERRVGYVDMRALADAVNGDNLTAALLYGDGNLKLENQDVLSVLNNVRQAAHVPVGVDLVTAIEGLYSLAERTLSEVEELKAMLGRSQTRVAHLETMTLNPADLYTQLEVQIELIEAYREATGGLQEAKEMAITVQALEETCVDLAKLLVKRNRQVRYWMGVARYRVDPKEFAEKVIITPADRIDYEHIRTGVISISPEAHKAERERRCKAIEASIRKCIKLDAIKFVGRIEVVSKVEQGVKEGAK